VQEGIKYAKPSLDEIAVPIFESGTAWPQHSFHAASFAVMPRWCFIGLGIFYEMVALKIRYHAFSSVRHSRGGFVLGKHIGWFTCPLLVGVGLAHHVLTRSFLINVYVVLQKEPLGTTRS
jgi:hypothetical protein